MAKTPFNLDALERVSDLDRFPVTHEGKTYNLIAPDEYEYSTALEIGKALSEGRAADALSVLVAPEDRAAFFEKPMQLWKVQRLVEAYNQHYGLGSAGE
jgi:hypothetical protein